MDLNSQFNVNYTTVPLPKNDTRPITKEEEALYREYEIREQDRWLPLANVGRVMKNALPSHAKLSKESKECVQECVSEFISFITSGAVDKCQMEKRKTLNGEDVLYAMHSLGFENYAETLKIYLAKYRQHECLEADDRREKDRMKRQLRKERKELEKREKTTVEGKDPNDQNPAALDSMDEDGSNFEDEGDEDQDQVDINELRYDIDNPAIEQYVLGTGTNDIYDENLNFDEQL